MIKNRNFDAMIQKISDLISNEKERKKIGIEARKSVEKFTSDKIAEEWIVLMEESERYE